MDLDETEQLIDSMGRIVACTSTCWIINLAQGENMLEFCPKIMHNIDIILFEKDLILYKIYLFLEILALLRKSLFLDFCLEGEEERRDMEVCHQVLIIMGGSIDGWGVHGHPYP